MDPGAIKEEIANSIRTAIPALNCFGYCPDSVPEPCFYVGEIEIDFDRAFQRGMDEMRVTCRLLVSRADDRAGQRALDTYLSGSGASSIKAAFHAARGAPGQPALGGLCDDLHLTRVQGYRMYEVGEVKFYGAELIVRIIGEG
ncbi:hypothetical protein ACQEVF_59530 [Nonomuraea polychroma]|uniref:hypothetical protein n=1 Tax=Nonomuraea polychroma TaxID=46176 RepID=UPI003D8DB2B1